jgi:type IV secretory pathway TraG/TraD family ATPase VirD4
MYFEIIGEITGIEIIAVGLNIRELAQLQKRYGKARWRKLKGVATVNIFANLSAP